MRKFIGIFFLGLLTACELFVSKEEATKRMVDEELMRIDWDDVDGYPLFDECRGDFSKEEQRACFEVTMTSKLAKALEDLEFEVNTNVKDTVWVDFLIDEDGFISIDNIEEKAEVLEEIENFNAEVSRRLNDFTTLAPAHKRGRNVSIRFRMPIVLNTR